MTAYDLDTLNARHAVAGQLRFTHEAGGATLAEIDNRHGRAVVALEGGQLLTWIPAGQAPVVWLSPAALYKPGKSLRGGVPVCWPWFGPHPTDAALPGHGFARNHPWEVSGSAALEEGATRLELAFLPNDATRALWPHTASLTLTVTVGAALRLELTTGNDGDTPITISEALHTYFQVGDISALSIEGLDGCRYADKVHGGEQTQQGAITVSGEVDRVYMGSEATCVIDDPLLKRRIRIAKSGSRSTVVWNPWAEKGAAFGDMGDDGYRHMLCVESANALADAVTLAPGERHTLMAEYSLES